MTDNNDSRPPLVEAQHPSGTSSSSEEDDELHRNTASLVREQLNQSILRSNTHRSRHSYLHRLLLESGQQTIPDAGAAGAHNRREHIGPSAAAPDLPLVDKADDAENNQRPSGTIASLDHQHENESTDASLSTREQQHFLRIRFRNDLPSLRRKRTQRRSDSIEKIRATEVVLSSQHTHKYVLDPIERPRRLWDLYLLFLLLYIATVSVFVYCFLGVLGVSTAWFWIERIIDISFLTDIILNFFTAYETKSGMMERRPRKIAQQYLRSWFIVDVLSTFPWDILTLVFKPGNDRDLLQLPRFLRLLRLLKLMRLLRVLRVKRSITQIEVRLRLKYGHVFIFWLAVSVLFVVHWVACLFFFFGSLADDQEKVSWISQDGIPADRFGLYVAALYFASYTVTTIGFGDVTPETTLERVYTCIVMLLGAAMFAFCISQLSNLVQDLSEKSSNYRRKMDQLMDFASVHQLPDDLVFDLRRYLLRRYKHDTAQHSNELISALSSDLRNRVMKHAYGDKMSRSRVFSLLSTKQQAELHTYITMQLGRPNEELYDFGDPPSKMFAILQGTVRITDVFNSEQILGPGDVFGEQDVVFERPRRERAVCMRYCDLIQLPGHAILNVVSRDANLLRSIRSDEITNLWKFAINRAEKEVHIWKIAKRLSNCAKTHFRESQNVQNVQNPQRSSATIDSTSADGVSTLEQPKTTSVRNDHIDIQCANPPQDGSRTILIEPQVLPVSSPTKNDSEQHPKSVLNTQSRTPLSGPGDSASSAEEVKNDEAVCMKRPDVTPEQSDNSNRFDHVYKGTQNMSRQELEEAYESQRQEIRYLQNRLRFFVSEAIALQEDLDHKYTDSTHLEPSAEDGH